MSGTWTFLYKRGMVYPVLLDMFCMSDSIAFSRSFSILFFISFYFLSCTYLSVFASGVGSLCIEGSGAGWWINA